MAQAISRRAKMKSELIEGPAIATLIRNARHRRESAANYWKPLQLDSEENRKHESFAADMALLAEKLEASKTCPISTRIQSEAYDRHIQLLMNRLEKGLMTYDACSYEELLRYCVQRHIPVTGSNIRKTNGSKRELMVTLLNADEEHVFHRFTELPPEVRNLIYGFSFEYFEACRTRGAARPPPPIAQVSRLLRNETLPLFYKDEYFMADFDMGSTLGIEQSKANDFVNIAPELFALIRTFMFDLDLHPCWSWWTVQLDLRGAGYEITFREGNEPEIDIPDDAVRQRVDRELREVIEIVAGRVGENETIELRPEDWFTLRKLFESAQEELHQRFSDDESDDE